MRPLIPIHRLAGAILLPAALAICFAGPVAAVELTQRCTNPDDDTMMGALSFGSGATLPDPAVAPPFGAGQLATARLALILLAVARVPRPVRREA